MIDFGRIGKFVRGAALGQGVKLADHDVKLVSNFMADEQAATSIEYALIAIIVGVGIVASVTSIVPELNSIFTSIEGYFVAILA